MHKLSIPPSVIERVIAKRGREHVYDELDPRKTALVVVEDTIATSIGRAAPRSGDVSARPAVSPRDKCYQ